MHRQNKVVFGFKVHEARLLCGSDPPVNWVGHPDLSKCVSSEVSHFQTQVGATLFTFVIDI